MPLRGIAHELYSGKGPCRLQKVCVMVREGNYSLTSHVFYGQVCSALVVIEHEM